MNKRRLKPIGKHFDKTVWCLLLGQYCYKECPHYYYREENGCMKRIKKQTRPKEATNEQRNKAFNG